MKTIAVEEHFAIPEYLDVVRDMLRKTYPNKATLEAEKLLDLEVKWLIGSFKTTSSSGEEITIENRLLDCGEGRLKTMREDGIDFQVLSLASPGLNILDPATSVPLSKLVNDRLAATVKQHPDKFAGLAALATQSPVDAANELERAVRQLGLKGACIDSHINGEYLDNKKFWPILETAEKLEVPIYIHPRVPSPQMYQAYADYPGLAGPGLGFSAETALHAMRLISSGVFDQYPNLKIVLGHLGEALPYWLWRMDDRLVKFSATPYELKRLPSQYFRDNFVVTTSGNYWLPAFMCAYLALGADNILFAVDYPFQSNSEAVPFLRNLEINPRDKEKLGHLNAERVFGLAH